MHSVFRSILAPKGEGAPRLTGGQAVAAWWQACRPPFLITAAIPVTLALAFATRMTGVALWGSYALVLAGCFFGLIVANFANDLFDHLQGVDSGGNIGGSRVIQTGLISPRQLAFASLGLVLAACAVAAWLVSLSGQTWLWGALLFTVASAVFYVAPPIKYGHRGLGEVFVALNMGFVMVSGTATVLAGCFYPQSLALALPVGLMVAGVLYYQSLPEIETDLQAGKHTLANILGKEKAAFLFRLWWPCIWALMLNLWACGVAGWPVWLGLLTYPLYRKADRLIRGALADEDWLGLDRHGHLVRKLYLVNGLLLILSQLPMDSAFQSFTALLF